MRFWHTIILIITFLAYLTMIGSFFFYFLINNDKNLDQLSFMNGILANFSTVILGTLAVVQSQKYKNDSDKRDETPILTMTSKIYLDDDIACDIICSIEDSKFYNINMYVCSFNKSVSNFTVDNMKLKKNRHDIREWTAISNLKGRYSKYNGIFLQDKFYYICFKCPQPIESHYLEINCSFYNIYFSKYKKKIILFGKDGQWALKETSRCKIERW